ncbi:MAG: Uroporphyrinogen decarboxylase (URO-D) [Rhodobacteraceae bacterium HLUCCA08]|nr:MAG: Uroporphyrinogen decarboxylase (URO-D) [Rhodobacteraceae bacterium HLUCCA08]
MRSRSRDMTRRSEGERARALAYVIIALFGAGMAFLAVTQLNDRAFFDRGLTWYEGYIILCGALGGMAALFLSGDRMGQQGPGGTLRGIAGGIWVSFVGAVIGGSLALPLYGTMFGPFTLAVTLAGAPLLMMIWISNLVAVHLLLRIWQRERDSIFVPARMTQPNNPDDLAARYRGRFG